MPKNIQLVAGQKFNKLTVIKLQKTEDRVYKSDRIKSGKRILHLEYYLCKCDCGKETVVEKSHLRKKVGATESCGCSMGTHHMSHKNRIWGIWAGIRKRCLGQNKNSPDYKNYRGRGIKICEEWKKDFMSFYNWAIQNGYKDNLTIERIDNNGNYDPSNCRWAPREEQSANRRGNRKILFDGKENTIKQLAEKMGLKYHTMYMKLKRNGVI